METEHTETVVEKAVSFVKDMLGIPAADHTPEVEAKPEYTDTPQEITSADALRPDPEAVTMKSVAEINADAVRRQNGV
jgi:hypothetical protein